MKMLAMLPLLLLSVAPAAAAEVALIDGDNCVLSPDTQSTNHLADIPAAIVKKISRLGESIPPAPLGAAPKKTAGTHLIRAFSRGQRWIIVYSAPAKFNDPRRVAVLDLSNDGGISQITNTELWRYPGGACQAVDIGFAAKPR